MDFPANGIVAAACYLDCWITIEVGLIYAQQASCLILTKL